MTGEDDVARSTVTRGGSPCVARRRRAVLALLFFGLWPAHASEAAPQRLPAAPPPKKHCSMCLSAKHGRPTCPDAMQSDVESESSTADESSSEARRRRLRAACKLGNAGEVDELLASGADANAYTARRMLDAPLHCAAYWGHATVVERLLHLGACASVRNRVDYTALHWASLRGATDVVRVLVAASADVNAVDVEGNTPLHFASREGFPQICGLLLQAGARINAITCVWHYTPLMYAAMRGEISCVRLLLLLGAHTEMRCAKGLDVLGWAHALHRHECAHLLSVVAGPRHAPDNITVLSPELVELEHLGLFDVRSRRWLSSRQASAHTDGCKMKGPAVDGGSESMSNS